MKFETGKLQAEELKHAEIVVIKDLQRSLLKDTNYNQWVYQLQLYEDQEGIIRLKGRLSNSSLGFDTKHPICLPSQHHASLLIIDQAHKAVMHNGLRDTCRNCVQSFGLSRDVRELKSRIYDCTVWKGVRQSPTCTFA